MVGTCIGAGFVSGAELVRFFGIDGFLLPGVLSSVVFFLLLTQALELGKKYNGYEGVMDALFARFAPVAKTVVILLALIPCAGLVAGFDALLPAYKPLLSVIGLLVVSLFVGKGMKGISLLNLVLVPALLCFLFYYGDAPYAFYEILPQNASGLFGGVLYAGMNTFLALPALMDAGKEMKRPRLSAVLSALFIGLCAVFVLGAIARMGEEALKNEMPFLAVTGKNPLFYLAAALAVATSLASALYPLFCACNRCAKGKPFKKFAARAIVLLAAFVLSRFGLKQIVGYFYPVLGILGLFFSAFCIFHEYLFEQNDEKIHRRRQSAQQKRRAHHQIELKHLPAVDDKIAKPRL